MPELPAICQDCGAVTGSGVVVGGNVRNARFGLVRTNCPVCGGTAEVPGGIYSTMGSALSYVASRPDAAAAMARIAQTLEAARARSATPDETVADLREALPDAPAEVWDFLESAKGQGLIALITLLLTAIGMALPYVKPEQSGIDPRDVSQIVSSAVTACMTAEHRSSGAEARPRQSQAASHRQVRSQKQHSARKRKHRRRGVRDARRRNR